MVFSVGNSIRAIQKNGLSKSFFLLGDDFFMQKIFIQNLKEKFSDLYEIEYFYFNESLDVDAFFNNINSMSLFGNKKISIIKNFSRLSSSHQKLLDNFFKQANSDNTLVFVLDDFMIKNKFSKKISEECIVVDTRTPFNKIKIKEWVRYYYNKENISIDDMSLDYLIDNYSDDIMNIINEIEKKYLICKTNDIKINEISSDYDSKHIKVWNLLDALGKKQINKSVEYYNNLYNNGVSLVPIIINLYNFYFQLFSKNNTPRGYNPLNKTIQSGMSGYRNKYKTDEVLNILLVLRDLDVLIKSSSINEKFLFSSIIIKICKNLFNEK